MNQKRCELCVLLPYLFDFRLRQKLGQFLSAKVRVNFKAAGAVSMHRHPSESQPCLNKQVQIQVTDHITDHRRKKKRVSLTAASNASPRCGT